MAERPQAERDATGATSRLEQRRLVIRKKTLDQHAFRSPEAELVRGTRVMNDREQVVEIGADRCRVDLFHR